MSHVAGARDGNDGPFEGLALGGQHFTSEVHQAVAGSFGTNQGTAVGQALSGEDTALEFVLKTLVHAKHVADFTTAHTDVTSRDVTVLANVAPEFHHEGLAKSHHFSVGFALRVEIGTAFAATHGQSGQRILEDLLEGEELQNGRVDAGVETKAAFVRADGAVELNSETTVHLDVAAVVNPRHTEVKQALRFDHALHHGDVFRVGLQNRLKRLKDFLDSLMEFGLVGVTGYDFCINCINGTHRHTFSHRSVYWPALMQTLSNGCP